MVSTDKAGMAQALQVLKAGGCVCVPTETVYGLAADATNGLAVARIFEMKGRPRFNPLICHVADIGMAERFGLMNAVARKLAARFWPGPLTLVVPSPPANGISELATAGLGTIGLRCPDSAARALIAGIWQAACRAQRQPVRQDFADHRRSCCGGIP